MAVSMQVAYPINDDTNFDIEYYIKNHLAIIKENWSEHIQQMVVTKGTSGGKDVPSPSVSYTHLTLPTIYSV